MTSSRDSRAWGLTEWPAPVSWPEAGNKGSPLEDNARDDILPLVALQGASSEGSSGTDSQMTNNTDWLEVAAKASMRPALMVESLGLQQCGRLGHWFWVPRTGAEIYWTQGMKSNHFSFIADYIQKIPE